MSRLISWPRKKLITKQLPNRSFLSQPDSGCASLRIPARGADRWTQILAGIGSPSATADARLRCGLALDGLGRRTSPSRHNQRTTHVEALGQEQQDGGSIPPASTEATLQATAKWLFHFPPAEGRKPNGLDFLAGASLGRAKLLLSRIPAASAAPTPAAPSKRWQSLTAETSLRWLGRSLALPSLHPSVLRITEIFNAIGRKPPAAFRTKGARAVECRIRLPLQGRLPADCRPAAGMASGRDYRSPQRRFADIVTGNRKTSTKGSGKNRGANSENLSIATRHETPKRRLRISGLGFMRE